MSGSHYILIASLLLAGCQEPAKPTPAASGPIGPQLMPNLSSGASPGEVKISFDLINFSLSNHGTGYIRTRMARGKFDRQPYSNLAASQGRYSRLENSEITYRYLPLGRHQVRAELVENGKVIKALSFPIEITRAAPVLKAAKPLAPQGSPQKPKRKPKPKNLAPLYTGIRINPRAPQPTYPILPPPVTVGGQENLSGGASLGAGGNQNLNLALAQNPDFFRENPDLAQNPLFITQSPFPYNQGFRDNNLGVEGLINP